MTASFENLFLDGDLLGDGPMGSALFARGIPYERCYESLCLTHPSLVLDVHVSHARSGAWMFRTNTFGANRFRLARHGLEDQVTAINSAATELLLGERFGVAGVVVGSVGPTGLSAEDVAKESRAVRGAFREQSDALLGAGCDAIFLETFRHPEEAILALDGVLSSVDHVPVVGLVAVDSELRMSDGTPLVDMARRLVAAGCLGVGVNCTDSLSVAERAISELLPLAVPVAVFPSAGIPRREGNTLSYPVRPADFGSFAVKALVDGARLVGGCCGATPEHLRAVLEVGRDRRYSARIPTPDLVPERWFAARGGGEPT